MKKLKQYCGPGMFTFEWLPKYKSCRFHDKRYEYALHRTFSTRAKIDRIFLYQMLIEKPNRRKTAYTYYYLVRMGGWVSFYLPLIKNIWK